MFTSRPLKIQRLTPDIVFNTKKPTVNKLADTFNIVDLSPKPTTQKSHTNTASSSSSSLSSSTSTIATSFSTQSDCNRVHSLSVGDERVPLPHGLSLSISLLNERDK